jgi:hypothetical protein
MREHAGRGEPEDQREHERERRREEQRSRTISHGRKRVGERAWKSTTARADRDGDLA